MTHISSACLQGVQALTVNVEVDVRSSENLHIHIVGLPDTATRESKDRLLPALTNSGYALDSLRAIINLSPAGIRKEGSAFDVAMALGILASMGILPQEALEKTLFLGELGLDGQLRPVPGVLASTERARAEGFHAVVVPRGCGRQAALVPKIQIYEVANLGQLVAGLRGRSSLQSMPPGAALQGQPTRSCEDMADVKGQLQGRRVLEIAAAGKHNIIMYGPPGSGKSMLGKRLISIMPPMTPDEIVEVTRIHSAMGNLPRGQAAITQRPYRAPHHTASSIALVGGGSTPIPGEVTRAHRGVLFLDELPEFSRHTLEVLRQPLEDGEVTISRAKISMTFPADFLMIAAMNPCPCGFLGDNARRCGCSQNAIQNYRNRISGPLLDRIDLQVEVPNLPISTLRRAPQSESSQSIRQRVLTAREIQLKRFENGLTFNGTMDQKKLDRFCELPEPLAVYLEEACEKRGCSKRVHDKILRVARTIADLSGTENIEKAHLSEALGYRQLDFDRQKDGLQEVVS